MVLLGRVTAIGIAIKKRIDRRKNKQPQKHYLVEFAEKQEKRLKRLQILRYKKFPIAVWFLGFVFLVFGISIITLILMHRHVLFDEFDHLSQFWKYFISISFCLVGFFAIATSEVYTLVINKNLDAFIQRKTPLLIGRSFYQGHVLKDLKAIFIEKRGHVARDTDTTNYYIVFEFEDGIKIDTVYDRKIQSIKYKYAEILIYLDREKDVDFSDIKYYDLATYNYKFVYQSPFQPKKDPVPQNQQVSKEDMKKYQQLVEKYRHVQDSDFSSDTDAQSSSDDDNDDGDDINNQRAARNKQKYISPNDTLQTQEESVQLRQPIKTE
ncbi:hypothetical protein ABPG72_009197 [Tetrahymena utriculariae]